MALYTIGDLHLSLGGSKPMDIFGDKWANHVERLHESFSHLTADDVTVLAGVLSWGISLEESLPDFQFIDALPISFPGSSPRVRGAADVATGVDHALGIIPARAGSRLKNPSSKHPIPLMWAPF